MGAEKPMPPSLKGAVTDVAKAHLIDDDELDKMVAEAMDEKKKAKPC